jgi:ABC-type Na+ efflux pump permease subunit
MIESANSRLSRMIAVWPRRRTAICGRILGLLAAAGVATSVWTTILVLVSDAWRLEISGRVILGFYLVVGVLSFLVAALLTAGRHSD